MQQNQYSTIAPLNPGCNSRASTLSKILGISKSTIWRLARQGKMPAPIKLSDKVTVWKNDDIIAWLSSKEAA